MKAFCISSIEEFSLSSFEFYVKRDDLLGLINGNKARKLHYFLKQDYAEYTRFISYGSSQSNALLALSIFCKQRNLSLIFVCERISSFLKENPSGNYLLALNNKAKIVENLSKEHRRDYALSLLKKDDIFIEEGIAMKEAEYGLANLAQEISLQANKLNMKFDIFLPSGTGTSAFFLAKNTNFDVYTCSCVGDDEYLKRQMLKLGQIPKNLFIVKKTKKFHFAKPYKELFKLYKQALAGGLEFDLLYDTVGLYTILENKTVFKNKLLYIHQGGLSGNLSMLKRYERKA